jgi:hypothetical protein
VCVWPPRAGTHIQRLKVRITWASVLSHPRRNALGECACSATLNPPRVYLPSEGALLLPAAPVACEGNERRVGGAMTALRRPLPLILLTTLNPFPPGGAMTALRQAGFQPRKAVANLQSSQQVRLRLVGFEHTEYPRCSWYACSPRSCACEHTYRAYPASACVCTQMRRNEYVCRCQ